MALDEEELAERDAVLAAEAEGAAEAAELEPPGPAVTPVRIWRAMLFLPYIAALVLVAVLLGLEAPVAALLVVFVAILYAVAGPRRVARYRFDDAGALFLDDAEEPLDWSAVTKIRVRHRAPFATSRARRELEPFVLDVRIELRDGGLIRFAGGDHFVDAPGRRLLTPGVFPRWLERRAREEGLSVEAENEVDWVARR